jgi:hypothetical protein
VIDPTKLIADSGEDPFFLGMLVGEFSAQAYSIAKGIRNVALFSAFDIRSEAAWLNLAQYVRELNASPGSRPIGFRSFIVNGATPSTARNIVMWADGHASDADIIEQLLNSSNRDELYHKEMGRILGYSQELIEGFIHG